MPLWPTVGSIVGAAVYYRGWRVARVTRPRELPLWRALCFFAGLLILWLALASPLDALGQFLQVAHMAQHLLLMWVAPPLLVLGFPTVPILRGLPRRFVVNDVAPWMNSRGFHFLQRLFTRPLFAWISVCVALLWWHIPFFYDLALRSPFWHDVEHGCFFFTGLCFWWVVIQPWPSRGKLTKWLVVPYFFSAHLVSLGLATFLALYDSVIYTAYLRVPRLFGWSALRDENVAGGEMLFVGLWVLIATLAPMIVSLLSDVPTKQKEGNDAVGIREQVKMPARFDLLRMPLGGSILKSRYGRPALQGASFCVVAILVLDGLQGTPLTPMNLAGSIFWNVARPINLFLFFVAGNLFCMACPFTLPREIARRLRIERIQWPRWLRNKWLAAGLMLVFFWAYEQFALWNSPRATAFLLIAYIAGALAVDSIFRDASFCKYVCPIGQFNFVTSLLSPLELGVKDHNTCTHCATRDCIRGNEQQRGCELQLYLPNKVGNADCTLCMDCVKACPHDNVAITAQPMVRELARDPNRSSLGRFSMREDVAVLVLVIVFSSVLSAAVMIAPVARFLEVLRQKYELIGASVISLLLSLLIGVALVLGFLVVAKMLQALSGRTGVRTAFCRFSIALLPLGVAMWSAHLSFHLATAWSSVPEVVRHTCADLVHGNHVPALAMSPDHMSMMASSTNFMLVPGSKGVDLLTLQVWMLNLGLLLSWYAGYKIIRPTTNSLRRSWAAIAIWVASSAAFYAVCIWIIVQPMQMRGMRM